jgi:penicillin-binding protein 2
MTAGPAVRHILEAYYGVEQSPKDPHPTGTPPLDSAEGAFTESASDAAPVE